MPALLPQLKLGSEVTKMHPVLAIGYAAAYPAYPLNPPLPVVV